MKKWTLFLSLYVCLCLLAGCVAGPAGPSLEELPEENRESTVVCRVISVLKDGTLILAEQDRDGLYTVSPADKALTLDGKDFDPAAPGAYQALPGASLAGTTVTVTFDGGVQESWPMGFSGVTALDFSAEGFDDLCALYLTVLEDLWNVDSGLNEGITELGVDLSATRLSESEQAAVAYAFGTAHGIMPIQGTWEELADQGHIDRENLYWEKGCLFSITEEDPSGPLRFDAQKWRSGLGAYFFCDCTAAQNADGHWGDYTVGSEAIS